MFEIGVKCLLTLQAFQVLFFLILVLMFALSVTYVCALCPSWVRFLA